ncbi:response regulator [Paenibacillus sp. YN15]|uniref:response regulator n=1 Tax=Paenibacillus sp. YN15 TaxID=1742774 RepID=UPI000DCB8C31|nr:response regulator [Paenibacillus sp. YN15]RAU96569.1 two-component system response regulator [Paenibacillus sp. YN15]
MRILIIDPAAFSRTVLRRIMEDAGYAIAGEAGNSEQALAQYKSASPDAVTIDLTAASLNGVALIRRIRDLDSSARILAISGMNQSALSQNAILAGAYDCVTKPLEESRLLAALAHAQLLLNEP